MTYFEDHLGLQISMTVEEALNFAVRIINTAQRATASREAYDRKVAIHTNRAGVDQPSAIAIAVYGTDSLTVQRGGV